MRSIILFVLLVCARASADERPNILWITSEDNGRFLGCYGDTRVATPNLDALAAAGTLYVHAYANAPVCAPARSTIATGMYACSLGTQHMRSKNPIPGDVRFMSAILRDAGYYCCNRSKEDYNTPTPSGAWDDSSGKATYRNRAEGQPFFAIVNIGQTHESSVHQSKPTRHDPATIELPPYHPDTPEFRQNWAEYLGRMEVLDQKVGELLDRLDADGLADDTIVFYYADHGGVLPRSKRFLYDSGTHVPMIVRMPERFAHLGTPAGTRSTRLVSFVDLAPTVLALAGLDAPDTMQGHAFLGAEPDAAPEYVFLFRDRMDERYDLSRGVTDGRYKYIRNFMPQRVWAQHLEYLYRMPAMKSWQREHDAGSLDDVTGRFFGTKPEEELYDLTTDPHEVENLAGSPELAAVQARLSAQLRLHMAAIDDLGVVPEAEMLRRADGVAPRGAVRGASRYFPKVGFDASDLEHADAVRRWWSVMACQRDPALAAGHRDTLIDLLDDESPDVRVAAAEIVARTQAELALETLRDAMTHEMQEVRLRAIGVLDRLDETARPALDVIRAATEDEWREVTRVAKKALADLGSD